MQKNYGSGDFVDARDQKGTAMTVSFANILERKDDSAPDLGTLDPRDYRDWSAWFELARGCVRAGVDRKTFIDWCCRDPEYVGDTKRIGRVWDSLSKRAKAAQTEERK
jgi:hypothetical protein